MFELFIRGTYIDNIDSFDALFKKIIDDGGLDINILIEVNEYRSVEKDVQA